MQHNDFERKSPLENPSAKLQELADNLAKIANYTPVSTIREHLTAAFNAVNAFMALDEGDECPEFHIVIEQIEAAKLCAARIGCNSIYAIVLSEHDAWEIFADVVVVETIDEPISPIGSLGWLNDDDTTLDNLVNEAIAANDFAVKEHPADECCPGCGGFSGCACEPVDPCENHAKGGWFIDPKDGKNKFLMPPYPGVDDICPKCGGYANSGGAK